jgi:hypothetical protein
MTASRTKKQPREGNIPEMINSLPAEERSIVNRLRALVLECLPKATEKSYYDLSIPFYTRHRLICFIWPPSIYWGKKKYTLKERGVTLGFSQGNRMSNEDGVLLKEGRKQVYCMYFKSLNEIDDMLIRALLFEAEMIDEGFGKAKGEKKN